MNDTAGSGALGIDINELLGEALAAETAGERAKALDVLELLVALRPKDEQVWMGIARLSENPTEKINALEIVLNINPNNQAAYKHLHALRQRQEHTAHKFIALAEDYYRRGQRAIKTKDEAEALRCFSQAIHLNPKHLAAWQQLAARSIQVAEKIEALKTIVRLRPGDQKARHKLKELSQIQNEPLALGRYYDQNKLPLLAAETYQHTLYTTRSAATRLEAQRLLDDAVIRRHIPNYRGVNPAFTLARLSLGPMVLYTLLVLLQAGLNPLHVSPVLCPSGILVAVGSILLASLHEKATRAVWLHLYGNRPGEKYLAAWFSIMGFVLLFLPFLFLLVDSLLRLQRLDL